MRIRAEEATIALDTGAAQLAEGDAAKSRRTLFWIRSCKQMRRRPRRPKEDERRPRRRPRRPRRRPLSLSSSTWRRSHLEGAMHKHCCGGSVPRSGLCAMFRRRRPGAGQVLPLVRRPAAAEEARRGFRGEAIAKALI